jgi:rRNA-processing protein FCF1
VKVLVDTNGLMVPAQHGIDVFEELKRLGYDECVVPSAVIDELEALKSRLRGSDLAALKVALAALAKETGSAVFTNDAALRKRLKKEGAKTIFMRSRHMLAVE